MFTIYVQSQFYPHDQARAAYYICHVQEESIVDGDIRQIVCAEGAKIGRYVGQVRCGGIRRSNPSRRPSCGDTPSTSV